MPVRARLGLIAALAISAAFSPAPTASAAPGDLDPTFGEGGVVQILSSNEESNAKSVAVQPDDKILVAGHELGDLAVIRLLENGQPDPTFSGDGKAVIELPSGFSEARAVTVQPDGKIVVAGGGQGATKGDFLVARFNADGKPDPGFGGGDGVVTLPVGDDDDEAFGVDVGADGRIAATGKAEAGGAEVAGVVVLLANGTPDDSFALDGDITVKTPPGHDTGEEVALLGDGRVLIADSSGAGGGDGFSLVQLLSSGLPDPEFGGGDGLVLTPIPAEGLAEGNGRITDFAVLGDGRIVASGYGDDFVGTPPDFDGKVAAVRYLPDGEIDVGFADSGFFTQQLPGSDAAEAVEPAEGGRLLLAGGYDEPTSGGRAPAALRLTADGDLDPVFGVGGVVLRPQTSPRDEYVDDAAVDSRDRLVTVGLLYRGGGATSVTVTRYLGDRQPEVPIAASNRSPHARMKAVPRRIPSKRLKAFSGTASDPDGDALRRVQIALVRLFPRGARASRRAPRRCSVLRNRRARFRLVRVKRGRRCPQRWLTVRGKARWRFPLKRRLPRGRYVVYARAVDARGLAESNFSRRLGNRYAFRVSRP